MTELAYLTAAELAPLIASKQLSLVELTSHILERIDRYDPTLRTYITPLPEFAMKQANAAESQIMRGKYLGPLHGIPIGIKDNYFTRGIRTTDGSKLFVDFIPSYDATAAARLISAGVIVLGKQNMHELAAGSTGTNPYFGTTRNPWNINYMPGGSSGGGTAALAAGLSTLATGTDTFGSIRLPAAMCGVYGLKPTYGLVSTYGIFPTAMSMDTAGPMARSVKDLASMLQYMAGYDQHDPASLSVPIPDYAASLNKGIRGLKIGVPVYYLQDLDPDVASVFEQAVGTLRYLGAEVQEIDIPELSTTTFTGFVTVTGEGGAFHQNWLRTRPDDYSPDIRAFFLTGSLTSIPQYLQAQQARRKMTQAIHTAFKQVDVLLGPTIPIVTPPFSDHWVEQNVEVVRRSLPYTAPVNLTGIPALAVPMGRSSHGLPLGMQIMGNHLSESLLLQIGHAWQQTNPL